MMPTQNDQFIITRNGKNAGPFTVSEFEQMLSVKQISVYDLVWRQGMTNWLPLGEILNVDRQATLSAAQISSPPSAEKEESVPQLLGQMALGCFLWIVLLALAVGGGIIFPFVLILLPFALIGGLIDMTRKLIKLLNREAVN